VLTITVPLSLLDHLFIVSLFVVLPLQGYRNYKKLIAAVRDGEVPDRPFWYRSTMASQWGALAIVLLAWFTFERPAEELGFAVHLNTGFWTSLVAGVAVLGYFAFTATQVSTLAPQQRAILRDRLGELGHFLPQSDRDLRYFTGLSLTAGVVEELLFRGYALWYLAHFLPTWAAVAVSSMAFGLGHAYQGAGGVLKTTTAGIVFAVMYLASGSIWLPIAFHAIFDAIQGVQIREVYRDGGVSVGTR